MILFDFDGVLVNSIYEVALTSYNALNGSTVRSLEELDAGYRALFLANRYHAQPAADFIPLARWCEKNCSRPNETLDNVEFKNLLLAEPLDKDARREAFFEARAQFIRDDRTSWLNVHSTFSPPWSFLQASPQTLVLLTNKNKAAVIELCSHFKLEINPDNIFSGDQGTSKLENLGKIRERFSSSRYYFIDDSIKNLRELKGKLGQDTDVDLWLAAWGYIGPTDTRDALSEDIGVVSQENCEDWITEHVQMK